MARGIVVIGDIHGRLDLFIKSLKLNGILDANNRWIKRGVHVIQMGDLIDRGPDSLKLLKYIHNLKKQANINDSTLDVLLGNHEVMALFSGLDNNFAKMHWYYNGGDTVYNEWLKATGREDYEASWPCLPEFYEDFSPTGFYGKLLIDNKAVIVKNNVLFSHGGVLETIDVNKINGQVKSTFLGEEANKYQKGIFNRNGLFWIREYNEERLQEVNKHNDVEFQVVGHTPKNGFSIEHKGNLFFVDVGIHQNNLPCVIEIFEDNVRVVTQGKTVFLEKPFKNTFIPLVNKKDIKKYPYKNPKYKIGDTIKLFSTATREFEVSFSVKNIAKDKYMTWYEGDITYKENGETRTEQGRWHIGQIDRNGKKE